MFYGPLRGSVICLRAEAAMRQILVLGSLNGDLVQHVPRIPIAGETLRGGGLHTFVGGKGANQACAAALLGGNVAMAGKVGTDVFAHRLIDGLREAGVNTNLVSRSDSPTGTAVILVLPSGENSIVISPGANGDVSIDFALDALERLNAGDLLLCQLEIPLESVSTALKVARNKGVTTILDPAPACPLSNDLIASVNILTPNQTEAALLLDTKCAPETFAEAEGCARKLLERGAETVIIKLGALGCFVANSQRTFTSAGFTVQAVDTTAAGDAFNGALAVALAEGAEFPSATRFANAAAAISVTKPGAIASMPSRAVVQQFLTEHV